MINGWKRLGWALALGTVMACTADSPKAVEALDASVATPAAVPRAKLKQLAGKVNVKRAAGDDWMVAQEGMDLFENDKVRTASGAQAVVETGSGAIAMGEDALIAIPESRGGDVTVLQGRIDARVDATQQTLTIKTPAAEIRAGREISFQ